MSTQLEKVIEILFDKPVSRNFKEKTKITCSYSQSVVLNNGDIACVYRQGKTKHSYDGIMIMQTSSDFGESWNNPQILFDGRSLDPPQSVISGVLCQGKDGSLLALVGFVDASKPDIYIFSKEGSVFKREVAALSSVNGMNWSKALIIDHSPFPKAYVAGKPFLLPNNILFIPLEVETKNGLQGTAATFSSDFGRSFEPASACAIDTEGKLNFSDGHFSILENGDILMLLWTFIQENEQTINIHQSISKDCCRSWSYPENTGLKGQLTTPLALGSGVVIAASNYRQEPEGIRLYISENNGKTWDKDNPIQMWDQLENRMLGHPVSSNKKCSKNNTIWDALPDFSFGTPDMVKLDDNSIIMTYYATINNITHIRACHFKVLI